MSKVLRTIRNNQGFIVLARNESSTRYVVKDEAVLDRLEALETVQFIGSGTVVKTTMEIMDLVYEAIDLEKISFVPTIVVDKDTSTYFMIVNESLAQQLNDGVWDYVDHMIKHSERVQSILNFYTSGVDYAIQFDMYEEEDNKVQTTVLYDGNDDHSGFAIEPSIFVADMSKYIDEDAHEIGED